MVIVQHLPLIKLVADALRMAFLFELGEAGSSLEKVIERLVLVD